MRLSYMVSISVVDIPGLITKDCNPKFQPGLQAKSLQPNFGLQKLNTQEFLIFQPSSNPTQRLATRNILPD
jgi:hypothetical protein